MFLLIGEDPFRARLRLAELVAALVSGGSTAPGDLSRIASPDLRGTVGVTRHDARTEGADAIAMSGRSQGLFDDPDERRVVVVEQAEAIADPSFITSFPADTALVLATTERMPSGRRRSRAPARPAALAKRDSAPPSLPDVVTSVGGQVERITPLSAEQVPGWITARARLAGAALEPRAVHELASAVGTDTDRIENELHKLATFAGGQPITDADVRALVAGAMEADVFELTRAVVRTPKDVRTAVATLERLLANGQAPQQILALLLWQFRVLLFASRMEDMAGAEKAAKAIRSSANAIARWRVEARRVSRQDVIRAYEALYATDLAIKQGRTEPETAMMLCVLDLCGVAGADPRDLIVGEPPRRGR